MSYYFGMYFTNANTLGEAMEKALEVVKAESSIQNIKKEIKDNIFFLNRILSKNKSEFTYTDEYAIRSWIKALCEFKFTYWPEQKLLGLVGNNYSQAKEIMGNYVPFQNSCDQNYDFEEWPNGIPFFENLVDEFKKMQQLELGECICELKKKNSDFISRYLEEEFDGENMDYYVKSELYTTIYDELNLDLWLYGHEHKSFKRFKLQGIDTEEKLFQLCTYVRAIIR